MHAWRQQLHCGQGFKWTQMNWNIQHLVVNSHKKWAPAALLPQKCWPNRWIVEKKTVAMIIISFYIPLPISICTISSISAIVACILTTYITPPTIIEVWNEHVIYIYIIGLRVFGGFGSQGGAYWNRWYRYPSRSRPFHPESQYVASTRRGLAATSPQPHILNTPGPFNLYLRK